MGEQQDRVAVAPADAREGPELALVLAGGGGTRFWPLSTEARPKQFLRLLGDASMLQESVARLEGLVPPERILVLTGERFVALTREQLPAIPEENIIGEPARRDTAAAVALGALIARARHGSGVMAVLTADHHIRPVDAFRRALVSAARGARAAPGALYTLGIPPTRPATGYGYLHLGEALPEAPAGASGGEPLAGEGATEGGRGERLRPLAHFRLRGFREKPDLETATRYLDSGEHLWNSGMFVWSLDAILGELRRQLPRHLAVLEGAVRHLGTPRFPPALEEAFRGLEATSIDYGVMEGARDVRAVVAPFRWSDVGGWVALGEHLERDGDGNAHAARLHTLDAGGNIVWSDDPGEEVALLGVHDLVVVRVGRRTLVCPKSRAEEIKRLVALGRLG